MTKGKILRSNPLPRPSSIGDIKGVLTNIEALNDLSATDVETEITKVATCTTNKITDAVVAHIDADISSVSAAALMPIFLFNAVKVDNFQAVAGAWEREINPSFYGGASLKNTNKALNDMVGLGAFFVPLTANYTLYLMYEMHDDKGIAKLILNNIDIVDVDMYAGAQELNHRSDHALGELTKGMHVLEIEISDKNVSSTSYGCRLMGVMITLT